MAALDLSSLELVSDEQVLHPAGTQSLVIARVVTLRYEGKLYRQNFWHHYGVPDCPLWHVEMYEVR